MNCVGDFVRITRPMTEDEENCVGLFKKYHKLRENNNLSLVLRMEDCFGVPSLKIIDNDGDGWWIPEAACETVIKGIQDIDFDDPDKLNG